RGTFTAPQVRAIRRILDDLGGALKWGGDYQRRADEMHFEIDATPSRVAQVAAAIRSGKLGAIRPAPGLPGTGVDNSAPWDGSSYPGTGAFVIGRKHDAVTVVQQRLTAHGINPGPVDGYWGTRTQAATQDFQRAQGWTGADADGIPGPTTWARLLTDPDPIDPLEEIMSYYESREELEQAVFEKARDGARSALAEPTIKGNADEWGSTLRNNIPLAAYRAGAAATSAAHALAAVRDLARQQGVDIDEAKLGRELAAAVGPVIRDLITEEAGEAVADKVIAKLAAKLG